MEKTTLTNAELRLIEQLCREGELNCARRAWLARRTEDHLSASSGHALEDRYRALRIKVARLPGEAAAARDAPPTAVVQP